MRSHYDDFAAGETNKMSSTNGNNNSNNGAIPYHARENSLPFSYGQISKTSTPLRPTTSSSSVSRNYKNGVEHDFDFDFDFGLSSTGRNGGGLGYDKTSNNSALNGSGKDVNYNTLTHSSDRANNRNNFYGGGSEKYLNNNYNNNESCTQSVKYNKTTTSSLTDETDASMIKAQPRLTSPLLVRKTLSNGNSNNHISSSRSPTRSTTNTIANTYHYSYGNTNNGSNVGDNFDKFGVNGNINNNDNYGHKIMYGGGDILTTKTPVRHDFDELLRERREKVFNEYRSTTHDLASPKASPLPPPRRFANGTVQLPSTLPPSLSNNKSSHPPQIPNRSQSQNSKYNYDFQFNLNLSDRHNDAEDEVDNVDILRRRTNTIDRSPQRQPQYQPQLQQQRQQQKQLYQTRDIPLASTYVERNYHTISSSSSSSTQANNNNNNNNNNSNNFYNRETLSPTSMLDIYATPYDERSKRSNVQPLEAISTSATATTLQRTKRSDYSTYGSGNINGHEHSNIGQTMTDRESSPIYATSTKKATTNNTIYRSSNNNSNTATLTATSPLSAATSTTTLTYTDYPSPTSARPETPAFPVTPRTPFAGGSIGNGYNSQMSTLNTRNTSYQQLQQQHQQQHQQQQQQNTLAEVQNYSTETIYGTNYRPRLNSSLSMANSEPQEVAAHLVKFAKDSSKFWYKPNLSREEAISLLINAAPGTFVVRDSTTYKNAYGLVLRVSQPPPGSTTTGKPDELVRHFLIEPTTRGVRLKGCANEPVFTSLSALVYQHSIHQLALPCLLQIPERDILPPLVEHTPAQKQLLTQGAACNVLWLFSCDTESLTGEEAIRKAIRQMYALSSAPNPTEVHFKVTQQGITLTDNTRKKFFRKHYTADIISYCAIDPDHRLWTMQEHGNDNITVVGALKKTIFAFVARRSASSKDNQCHVFCDLAINQPASAIVSFVNKTLPTEKQKNYVL